jgi:hypothetical protein
MSPRALPKVKRRLRASASAVLNPLQHPDAAGVDVGAEELVAAVPPDRAPEPVRTFSSFTTGVHALRDWFLACQIKTVAIESTGNYWITLYSVLEEAGLDVYLVNARSAKGVPGKKTDVCDAQWLPQLHQAGLLRKSFRPSQEVRPLRYLMRHRQELVRDACRQLQRAQKVLTEMNLHLHHVFSDLDGQSAQRIIEAILRGERDPHRLAALRDRRCRTPLTRVLEALAGDYRPELLFVLQQTQDRRAQIAAAVTACDAQIERLCAAVPSDPPPPAAAESPEATASTEATETTETTTGAAPAGRPCPQISAAKAYERQYKNGLGFAILQEGWRFYGVDLSTIDGIGSHHGGCAHERSGHRRAAPGGLWERGRFLLVARALSGHPHHRRQSAAKQNPTGEEPARAGLSHGGPSGGPQPQ